jgi:hypothetical protein
MNIIFSVSPSIRYTPSTDFFCSFLGATGSKEYSACCLLDASYLVFSSVYLVLDLVVFFLSSPHGIVAFVTG